MIHIKTISFNPFQENTYLLHNDKGDTIIIDPGCYGKDEELFLEKTLSDNNLSPKRLILTHSHIDHVLGAYFVCKNYNLLPENHEIDMETFNSVEGYAPAYGFNYTAAPSPKKHLKEGDIITIGEEELEVIFVPGHAPGHIVLYSKKQHFAIGGDVLFRQSIGRTDLPGGNHEQLIEMIKTKMFALPDNTVVYPGHGPETTIGYEKANNPFLV